MRGFVLIQDKYVSLEELRADVDAAYRKGLGGKWAFTPETVEALLMEIEQKETIMNVLEDYFGRKER